MAPRVRARVKKELLIWARNSAGLTPAEAAQKVGVDEERLAGWEAGVDLPTIPQLRKVAAAYRRPLAVFYLQEVPRDFQVIRDLRRLPGVGFRRLPPTLLLATRRAEQRRQLALELAEDLGEELPEFRLRASLDENPEVVGERIRIALEITNDEQSRWRDGEGRAGFNAWRTRIEAVGALVFQATEFAANEASGFAIAEDRLPIVVVNRKDTPTRRTFSLVHELAHLMLRISGVSDLDVDEARPPEDQRIEIFSNRVAAAALMPERWLLSNARVVEHGPRSVAWTDVEISDLARSFGVSREALVRRLLTFGRTTEAFYREKRRQYLAEYQELRQQRRDQAPEDGIPRNMPREAVSNLGRPLVRMILDTYYRDRLTLSDVAGYLGIKTRHIAKLEQLTGVR